MTRRTARFAPSPTGPLHLGSLLAAVAGFLDARAGGQVWTLRIDDLDQPRCVAGCEESILSLLSACGMQPDRPPTRQSTRDADYGQAMKQLRQAGHCFDCGCSRRDISDIARVTDEGAIYPGTCRNGLPDGREPRSVRLRVPDRLIRFEDRVQGIIEQNLAQDVGDFVIRRADGLFAYQLAVVIDDHLESITDIVRGADLLSSTPRQIYLHQLLDLPVPRYLHIPVIVDQSGNKLSKSDGAAAVDESNLAESILRVLRALGQSTEGCRAEQDPAVIIEQAVARWDIKRIPDRRSLVIDALL